jgi:pilus assembly protein CpaB
VIGHRARGLVLLGAATACAGTAATAVRNEGRQVRAQVGGLVPAVIVTRPVAAGTSFTPSLSATHLAVREVPQRFAPPAALIAVPDSVGSRTTASLRAGDYLTAGVLRSAGPTRAERRQAPPGRVVEVEVSGAATIAPLLQPGIAVDVLITTQRSGSSRTYLALQGVQLASFAARDDAGPHGTSGIASLRVSLREAVLLTAAQSFATELRLVPRPPGDRRQPRFEVREREL